jgi:hypothetical protein
MPVELSASDVSELVRKGHQRVEHYRNAAAQSVKDYVGNYYVRPSGMTGEYPINLIFAALRTWVPNLIMQAGMNKVLTPLVSQSDYAFMLGEALNELHKKIKMKNVIRAGVVNMILCGLAVFKTSIFASGNLIPDGPNEYIDPGQLYTDLISIDDFFFDPYCVALNKSTLTGHFTTVRRQDLLDDEGWDEKLVRRLPNAWDGGANDNNKARLLTRNPSLTLEMINAQDYVRVGEVYLPEANAIAYVPDPKQATYDNFLKVQDYYGPSTGPYTFGSITPPVPDNPFPVAPASIWRDLNLMANSLFTKLMNQADNQKDVLLYKPGMEDVADAIASAVDGQQIRTPDPQGVEVKSYGGGNPSNDKMTQELQFWFNYMSGGIDQMSGLKTGAGSKTATAVKTLQNNATITQEDARSMVSDTQADISEKQAWFIHNDPFLNAPLTIRSTGKSPQQVVLTPEEVRGDFLSMTFTIVKRSMQGVDPEHRRLALEKMLVNIIPGTANAAVMFQQMGQGFDAGLLLTNAAEELGITELFAGVFNDPDFQRRLQMAAQAAGLDPGKAGKSGGASPAGAMQNNGNPQAVPVKNEQQGFNQQAQAGANQAQSEIAGGFG